MKLTEKEREEILNDEKLFKFILSYVYRTGIDPTETLFSNIESLLAKKVEEAKREYAAEIRRSLDRKEMILKGFIDGYLTRATDYDGSFNEVMDLSSDLKEKLWIKLS